MTTPAPPSASLIPGSIIADGAMRFDWVPAIVDPLNPKLTEINAAGAVPLSCYFTGVNLGTEEASITDDRVCSRETFEAPGRVQDSLEPTYVYDPQNLTPSENLAYTTLKGRTKGFMVARWGVDFEDPFAVGQFVDVYPVTCGVQRKLPGEANSTLKATQKMFIRARVRRDVAVVA